MSKLLDLKRELTAAVERLNMEECFKDADEYAAQEIVVKEIEGNISRLEKATQRSIDLAKPVVSNGATNDRDLYDPDFIDGVRYSPDTQSRDWRNAAEARLPANRRDFQAYVRESRRELQFNFDRGRHFASFGELLRAVYAYYESRGASSDTRLVRAPTGMNEGDPSAGGFLVQTDFVNAVFMRAYDMGSILGATQKLTISSGSNSVKIPGVDETSRATGSRWGGVSSTWVAEGTGVTASRPKFRIIELDLKKLLSTMYITDEMLADQNLLTTIASQAFSEELMFMTEDAIIEGTGAGMPLGILNAPCLVSVTKEVGQAAKTIVKENIDNMWMRLWARSVPNSSWYVNTDVYPALASLSQVVGTGGVPVYLPPGGYSQAPYGTLMGRPVQPVEYCSTLGTVGDIILADFSQYVVAQKGGMQAATSMHVAFLTDEMVYRITYRVDGEPLWHSALTPFKGTNTKSPFVVLANRA